MKNNWRSVLAWLVFWLIFVALFMFLFIQFLLWLRRVGW
jgi:hypothetical protein